jgi:alanyl-tRNA synthetase
MTSHEIRRTFLDFFESKNHKIVPSAPLVLKNDPTLMFTNSGMVQFKDYFLGNGTPPSVRIADTQKCLRVSGKHNDLEDVGFDGTHHTLFEMLGNWSFGDYFKEEAIEWSWELLHDVLGLEKDRLFATVFGGDTKEDLASDEEARNYWRRYLPDNQILDGSKKDNFWEMGAQGPCGPCSEIHYDFRSDADRAAIPGEELVNKDHPQVVEIWNNVFMQFERKADGSLVVLPSQHVDTGMGFERLCMVLQGKQFTYDTDVFTPLIQHIEQKSGIKYSGSYDRSALSDVAIRVVADHIRAVAFTIADGQLPASGGAGYVIRRILRRAVRYTYSFLHVKEPFFNTLIPILAKEFADVFPELNAQKDFVQKVVLEEEKSFLRTLESGLKRMDNIPASNNQISGADAFELFDTYGFPLDLTELIAREKGLSVDTTGFELALQAQKARSRKDAAKQVGDWNIPTSASDNEAENRVEFIGYDDLFVSEARILKYRKVEDKNGSSFQVVLNRTPFYAESGGQVGDTGRLTMISANGDIADIEVIDTKKENDLIIQVVSHLPEWIDGEVEVAAQVDHKRRDRISKNHSAGHLMHAAWNLMALYEFEVTKNGEDDLFKFKK